jgi:PAS domain S-box-containing protein
MSPQDEGQRLEGAEGVLKALRQGQADIVAGERGVAFLRLHEVEEELRRSQEYFQALAEQIPDVVWFVETDPLRVTYINRAFEEVWGMSCERIYRDPNAWVGSLDPEDRPRVQAAFASFVQGARPAYHEEYRIIRPDGEIRWISDKAVAIRDGQGRVTRVGGISADITDVKEGQRQLTEATRRLQALMHALPVGVTFSEDDTCQHITGNPTALEQFEIAAEDNLSASALDAAAPGRQREPPDPARRARGTPAQRAAVVCAGERFPGAGRSGFGDRRSRRDG